MEYPQQHEDIKQAGANDAHTHTHAIVHRCIIMFLPAPRPIHATPRSFASSLCLCLHLCPALKLT